MKLATTKRPKKPKPEPSYTPWPCSILAVDPGERSGWALYDRGKPVSSGELDLFTDEPKAVMAALLAMPAPHVVVIERPFMVRFGTQVAVGAGDLFWRRLAERNGLTRRIVRVYPATWRSKTTRMHAAKRDAARAVEQRQAAALVGRECGPDESAALLIGTWAIRAGEVGKVLPKRAPKVSKLAAAV